ncbi:helix-turn-helix domain-containing protein [Paenibacillus sp. NPDC093718]|uniref:helix-turn-helix domain-containing protein n=1 Tax=Paenibacillus sp. NPDC093718 TaxID=3390601 RepID=UPI003D08CCB5
MYLQRIQAAGCAYEQDLLRLTGVSSATMAKLNTNEYVSLEVIDKLCSALGCQPGDLLEHIAEQ